MINYKLGVETEEYLNMESKHIVAGSNNSDVLNMLSIKYRTKKSFLYEFTSLHMVVPTLCCNSKCIYCQVSSKDEHEGSYYMDKPTANKVVETIFKSPSKHIKIEFQGGEPLLNIDIVKHIISYANKINKMFNKTLQFIICTNLQLITEDLLYYLKDNNVLLSTSLDGPRDLHSTNRPLKNKENSYDQFKNNLLMAKNIIGQQHISALMTTTRQSINKAKSIIDEYVDNGFNYIFIRNLNPYGLARDNATDVDYPIEEFIAFYKEALEYIIDINLKGTYLIEGYTNILLRKILTPFSTGFVDLQSPAGVGISGAIYNYNGNVYASDEGRMLASMGDERFLLGNVHNNTYEEIFSGQRLVSLISGSCCEALPGCAWCAYMPYCGADPVRNYVETGDIVGHRATSQSCKKNKAILKHLIKIIEKENNDITDIFWSWITRRPLNEIKNKAVV